MESQRTTIALGPLEISFTRREEGGRLGVFGSLAAHALVLALLMLVGSHQKSVVEAEITPPTKSPVPITFVDPLPRQPQPRPDEIAQHRPPPPTQAKPLRMQSVPETMSAPKLSVKDQASKDAGRHDKNPAGGEQGGPRPVPTPGTPPPAPDGADRQTTNNDAATNPDEPKDILGRLRDFKRAVEAPRPSTPHGPEGGGKGTGGVTMPALPPTGFGIGNLEFEGRDYDWESYGRQIHGIIWRAWHNRLLTTSSVFERWAAENRNWMLDHRNGVRFTILKTGQVVDVAIETPSGCYPLDDSATDALREVVLPPLPADFQRETETVHARFVAEGEIRTMHAFLQQMKNAGYF
jgi:outer membrane biosynthesis protein TonB